MLTRREAGTPFPPGGDAKRAATLGSAALRLFKR